MKPKASILWVNHNSSSFIDLTLESLMAVKELDYDNRELIGVDNGSDDGSFPVVKRFIEKKGIKGKLVPLGRNTGFTGGNNVAYANRDPDSKYVVLLNNDAVPTSESLRELVDYMENDQTLGATQGIILDYDRKTIDTAGDYLSEFLVTYPLCEGKTSASLKKSVYITSADGAYSIFRVEAIKKSMQPCNGMFDDYIFACFDDYTLGLKLWNNGFKIKTVPIITAKHRRGTSFRKAKPLLAYLYMRNWIILNEISNSRYRNLIRLLFLKQLSASFLLMISKFGLEPSSREHSNILSRAVADGIRIGNARRKLQERIDLYKAPVLQIDPSAAISGTAISLRMADLDAKRELEKVAHSIAPEQVQTVKKSVL